MTDALSIHAFSRTLARLNLEGNKTTALSRRIMRTIVKLYCIV